MTRYSELLLDHARHPRNLGRNPDADAIGSADFNGQPPTVELYLRIERGVVTSALFHAEGCGVTIAAGSALTELLKGRNVMECLELGPEDVSDELQGIPGDKMYCAHTAIWALQKALLTVC
jgi:nitrogen fixation NifU-like protein